MVEVGENIEKSPGDLRRLAVIQTLVKNPFANTDVKNSQRVNNNNNNNNNNNYYLMKITITGKQNMNNLTKNIAKRIPIKWEKNWKCKF